MRIKRVQIKKIIFYLAAKELNKNIDVNFVKLKKKRIFRFYKFLIKNSIVFFIFSLIIFLSSNFINFSSLSFKNLIRSPYNELMIRKIKFFNKLFRFVNFLEFK